MKKVPILLVVMAMPFVLIAAAVARNHIVRLNLKGALDLAFDPNANEAVRKPASTADTQASRELDEHVTGNNKSTDQGIIVSFDLHTG